MAGSRRPFLKSTRIHVARASRPCQTSRHVARSHSAADTRSLYLSLRLIRTTRMAIPGAQKTARRRRRTDAFQDSSASSSRNRARTLPDDGGRCGGHARERNARRGLVRAAANTQLERLRPQRCATWGMLLINRLTSCTVLGILLVSAGELGDRLDAERVEHAASAHTRERLQHPLTPPPSEHSEANSRAWSPELEREAIVTLRLAGPRNGDTDDAPLGLRKRRRSCAHPSRSRSQTLTKSHSSAGLRSE